VLLYTPHCTCHAADFDYRHTTSSSLRLPGKVHAGFAGIAQQLWDNGLKAALDSHALSGRASTVQFSGHSLGAGVAALLSYASQVSTCLINLMQCNMSPNKTHGDGCWHTVGRILHLAALLSYANQVSSTSVMQCSY
jgi:predicted alpha/beta hydrolase